MQENTDAFGLRFNCKNRGLLYELTAKSASNAPVYDLTAEHSNIIHGFQKLQIASVACRISETISAGISSTEIRPEFDTSNAGMLQSGMPRLARCQEFHRVSMRRHRVLSRQSGGLKRKNPWPSRTSLLRLIFSPVAFVFSS